MILVRKNFQIQGLTTAAGIWLVACLGITMATDAWPLALIATALWFLITHFFSYFEKKYYDEGVNENDEK